MAESVKVIVRCRPMNSREISLKCKSVVVMDSERCSCSIMNPTDSSAPSKTFTFDGVYSVGSTTEQIYNESAYPLIEGVLEGYNSTVFAYGQTGCGKSFSMQGINEPQSQRGIIPRAFEHIFEAISVTQDVKYLVLASYLEIYNEEIRDLLGPDVKQKLDLKESHDKGVYVQDLTWHAVGCVADCENLMCKGWANRSVGATLMNADSSRSHSIFSISVEMMATDGLNEGSIKRGKLSLVDLAGSERQAKTGAQGDRLKEASKINLSLSALGNVISALVDGKAKHIPYRDSKLTRLLQDSLGGNTKTLMLACLSPADNNYDETLSTLRYANRAKNIKNQPHINEDPKDAMLRQYQEEIERLKEMLTKPKMTAVVDEVILEQEREKIRIEYEKELAAMKAQFTDLNISRNQVQDELENLKMQYDSQIQDINKKSVFKQTKLTVMAGDTCTEVNETLNKDNEENSQNNNQSISKASQQQILARLVKLQKSLVGGEKVGDQGLKERRARRKKAAEKRLAALAEVLAKEEHSSLVLGVYDDMHDQLTARSENLKKHRHKIRSLEREIADLQSEFETERTDYLETIRRLDRQLMLHNQILDKVIPNLKGPSNYSSIESIKNESKWDDDLQCWIVPDFTVLRTKLPPAGSSWRNSSQTAPGRLQKLDLNEEEDFAGNYFKPKRATELLIKAQQDVARANGYIYGQKGLNLQGSLNSIHNTLSSFKNNPQSFLNHSWSGTQSQINGWVDSNNRKPARLEALPLVDRKPVIKPQLNTLDVI
ncbi:osmotic avoidance abnormal protein 3 isoform X2 [Cimex lectularius]|uniref:Kinesin-like protein n=1 Tax=Cimex lectularius TaxID=79782 RepID=A0A8I6RF04_CIMLE|nr:osmotic avoidance abnormal protein 3 isoform X2 [Cimex lectularius]